MKAAILRFDPAVDAEPYYASYEVPWREHITVLEVLMYVYENHDPIAFDYSCRGRVCGRCAMMLDGEPMMACYTPIDSDRDITIEPLKGFPVVRDLIVDKSKIHSRLSTMYNRIRYQPLTKEEVAAPYDHDAYDNIKPLEWCARCLSCIASCPTYSSPAGPGSFIGPAGIIALGMRHYDIHDQGDRIVEAVQNGLYECILCGKCTEVCPADEIQHLDVYAALRATAEERDLKPTGK